MYDVTQLGLLYCCGTIVPATKSWLMVVIPSLLCICLRKRRRSVSSSCPDSRQDRFYAVQEANEASRSISVRAHSKRCILGVYISFSAHPKVKLKVLL